MAIAAGLTNPAAGEPKQAWIDEMDLSSMTSGFGQATARSPVDGSGIGTHAVSRLVIDLGGAARRFQAVLALDDESNSTASANYLVIADGETLFDSGVMKMKESKQVDVDLAGKRLLTLLVDDAGDGIVADHADWADAHIIYSGKPPTPYQHDRRWKLHDDGSIRWDIPSEPLAIGHEDHIDIKVTRKGEQQLLKVKDGNKTIVSQPIDGKPPVQIQLPSPTHCPDSAWRGSAQPQTLNHTH